MIRRQLKDALHPRNRFRDGYDFQALADQSAALAMFVRENAYGDLSIDFADAAAVKALNQALLARAYGLHAWDVPAGYLCPAIPGRSDYLHYVADLLAANRQVRSRRGSISMLDIGAGANVIYPLIGAAEYGWRFVALEADAAAFQWGKRLVAANPSVADLIDCRHQPRPLECFGGILKADERFAASVCNPPFHRSAAEAAEGHRRKRRGLGSTGRGPARPNFGGTARELWCQGGELGFIHRMIVQSAEQPWRCQWFTTLVSKSTHLSALRHALREVHADDVRTIDMAHGQKRSRILAWTFRRTETSR